MTGWAAHVAGVVWVLEQVGHRVPGAQLDITSDVPVGAGLSSSAASILSRAGHALFLDCRDLHAEHIPFDLAADGLTILVTDTNAPHRLVSGEYAARRHSCEQAAAMLGVPALRDATTADLDRLDDPTLRRRARHVITENQRVLDAVTRCATAKRARSAR